jgi:hypothetical protein
MAKRKKKIQVDREFLKELEALERRFREQIAKDHEVIGRAKEIQRRLRKIYAGQ